MRVPEPEQWSEQSGCPQHELKQHCPAGQLLPESHGENDEQKPSRRSMHVQLELLASQKQAPLPLHPAQGITTSQHMLGEQPHGLAQSPQLHGAHLWSGPMSQPHKPPPWRARHFACLFAFLHIL
jgi:hypothetical protein